MFAVSNALPPATLGSVLKYASSFS